MYRILILGGAGQVGTELTRYKWRDNFELVIPTRIDLDLADAPLVKRSVIDGDFAAVINCGAYTAVDRAESDIVNAWQINALGPAALAEATKICGIPLVHVSTDYVFDGQKASPYDPSDGVSPINVYGGSKEAGEQAVRTASANHVILRTAWVFSQHRSNFVKTMLNLAQQHTSLRVVNDQIGNPTSAKDIADTLVKLTTRLLDDATAPRGTYHFVNAGDATWYEFAQRVFEIRRAMGKPSPELNPISTVDYPTPARRPSNSRLAVSTIECDFGIAPRHWQDALSEVLHDLKGV